MKKIVIAIAVALILPNSALVFADKPEKENWKQEQEHRKHIRKMDREEQKYHKKMSHKHKKGKKLPSDWKKRVIKGRHLDDDIYIHLEPVPKDIFRTLPPLPPGFSYKQIEDDIIKLNNINREIIDVLKKNKIPVPPIPKLPGLE